MCQVSSPLHAEFNAARRAVDFLLEHENFTLNVVLEGDSSVAIAAVSRQEEDNSLLGPIINDIRGALHGLNGVMLQFVHREANNVAHRLARMGLGVSVEAPWEGDPPDLILDALLEDNQL
ncbi:hypothetical protein ACFX10_003132 [Malus domestica]